MKSLQVEFLEEEKEYDNNVLVTYHCSHEPLRRKTFRGYQSLDSILAYFEREVKAESTSDPCEEIPF